MKTFRVKAKGESPLLHHRMTEDSLFELLGSRAKKKKVKEEIIPREIAEQHSYRNKDGSYCIPLDYIRSAFIQASSNYKQKDSSRKSYKSCAGGIFTPIGDFTTLFDDEGNPIIDFEVDIRKGTNHLKGAVAVCRPRFDRWNLDFEIEIDDDVLPSEMALQILQDAGKKVGIGSFRVSKSGYFGKFNIVEWTEIKD